MADPSGRSNAMYGSYKPAVLVGMQPPTADRMGEGMPTYTHLMQPATAPCMNQSALLDGRLPPTTLLTSTKPANLQDADKESCASEGWLDDDKFGAEDKGPSQDYTYCGVDLKPVLPVALAVSTVLGGLCMLLVQIPMLSRFTALSQVWLSAPFAVVYCIVLGCMAYCAYADPGQVRKTRKMKIDAVGGMDIEEGMPRRAYKSWRYSRPIRRYAYMIIMQMVAKCHWSSQSPWICDSGGRFAVNWSAWDHGRHLACHLDRWEGLLWVWDRCGASFGIFRCSPGDWWANFQDPFWTDLKERDGPGMEEERALRGQQHQHRRQRASGGSWGWWVQWALRPWRLCVRSHKEPFWQRLLHQLHKLLVPASLDFRCKGGVLISQCAWVSLPWLKSQASMGKIKRTYIISRLGWWQSQWCGLKQTRIKRSKWLKGKKRNVSGCEHKCSSAKGRRIAGDWVAKFVF